MSRSESLNRFNSARSRASDITTSTIENGTESIDRTIDKSFDSFDRNAPQFMEVAGGTVEEGIASGERLADKGLDSFDRSVDRAADVAEYGIEQGVNTVNKGLDILDRGISLVEENKDDIKELVEKEIASFKSDTLKIVKAIVDALKSVANQLSGFFRAFKALLILLIILIIVTIIYLIIWMGVGIKWMMQTWLCKCPN